MRVGVLVPARDEEGFLARCLDSLGAFRSAGDPILVVDNASADGTAATARGRGVEVVAEPRPGRGWAVGTGYRALSARCDWILVVHADMVVSEGARAAIAEAVAARPRLVLGALGHRIDDPRPVFRLLEAGNRFRARRLGLPYGDQGQFFSVAALERAGGFPEVEALEDVALARRLRRAGTRVYLDEPVRIPARHWERGVVRTTVRNLSTVAASLWGGRP